jgi:hypothetical protein
LNSRLSSPDERSIHKARIEWARVVRTFISVVQLMRLDNDIYRAIVAPLKRDVDNVMLNRRADGGEEPVDEEPVGEEPVGEEPVDEEPVGEEPVGEEPVDEEPVDEEPAGEPEA